MKLQDRDERVLRCCYEQRFLLAEQIHKYFFKDRLPWTAYRRIAIMEAAGLLKRDRKPTLDGKRLIQLTPLGLRFVTSDYAEAIPQGKSIDVATMSHDAIVTSVSLRLRQLWDAVWVPERALKKENYSQIPDGIFVFDSGTKIAVEVENSPKGRTRFLKLLDRWRGEKIQMVLYVTTRPQLYDLIQGYLPEGPKSVVFGLVHWDALELGTASVWSTKGKLDLFSKRRL